MNIEHTVRYAGFWPRLLAHNIDLIPILGLFYLSTLIPSREYTIFILGGIYLSYYTLFELSHWQATPGKRFVKIKVAGKEGKTKPLLILIRNVSKIVSLILFFGGFTMIFFHPRRQGLHDYIAGTLVLFGEE